VRANSESSIFAVFAEYQELSKPKTLRRGFMIGMAPDARSVKVTFTPEFNLKYYY